VLFPDPSFESQPGAELESVKLRFVRGFNASAKVSDAGANVAATTANTAPNIEPRRTIDLSLFILIFLLIVCFALPIKKVYRRILPLAV
jgi:hypothetical protein